jgi:formate dehydrogenase
LPEPEIHARLVEAMGAMPLDAVDRLRDALRNGGRAAFARDWSALARDRPDVGRAAPVVLYRTLGESLPRGAESAAALWGAAYTCASLYPESIRRAGIGAGRPAAERGGAPLDGPQLAEALFDAIVESPTGLVFTHDSPEESWKRVGTADGRIHLEIPELLEELATMLAAPALDRVASAEFPFVLSAGERRAYTANTICRDPDWRKHDAQGALCMSPGDASSLGVGAGDLVRVVTRRGAAEIPVEISDRLQRGHVSLPNGLGVDYPGPGGGPRTVRGIAPNELTAVEDRDWLAGTPWHKSVPARIERVVR